jgi:hypothetical protein
MKTETEIGGYVTFATRKIRETYMRGELGAVEVTLRA